MPAPPVARIRFTSFIITWVISMELSSIQQMIFSGRPAFSAASRMMRAASMVQRLAVGWGEIRMALRVFRQIRILKMQVEVGFVVGVTAPTMPTGSAIRLVPKALSSEITPQVFLWRK